MEVAASAPLVVIITGPPASGKSMLGRELARRLALPLLSKDLFKEVLFDQLGWSDREWSPAHCHVYSVMDNLNAHTPGSLYEAFDPTEARRLADKLEIHYTPKYASWLDMAEIELSVLTGQCLDRRIPDKVTLVREVTAWMHGRNVRQSGIDWRFTTADARIKLKRLYPAILP